MPRNLRAILTPDLLEEPLMKQALTHRSADRSHNERIEFLGDAVLGVLVSDLLYRRFPSFAEGELTKLRSYLVREDTLAEIARSVNLSELVVVGRGESRHGGLQRGALLADTLEAVIGALYLLRGMDCTAEFIREAFDERLVHIPSPDALKDAKTRLQEYLQAGGHALPVYEMREKTRRGDFHVVCKVAAFGLEFPGEAASKRKAEQKAAAGVLEQLPPVR